MTTLQELRDQRASAWAQAQEYNNRDERGENLSAEDEAAWTRALAEVDRLGDLIENRERTAALDERFAEIDGEQAERNGGAPAGGGRSSDGTGGGGDDEAAYRDAFDAFVRFGMSEIEPDQRALLRQRAVNLRAQGVSTGAGGGFTVPEGFWAKVTETMKFFAAVAQFAEVLNTDSGEAIPWPTNDDTANEGELVTENTTVTEGDLTFGTAQLDAYMYSSKLVRASLQFLQDNGVNAESYLARKLGERLGRVTNRHFTVGTGVDQPQGYIVGATIGKTTASIAAGITHDDLVDLVHSVDVAYRMNARFAVHDLILAVIRKLKDANDRPLWQPTIAADVPDTILGYPYFVNNYQASAIAANALVAAFGDFRAGVAVRNVSGGTLLRLTERYAEFLQVGFLGFSRHDSVVQDPSAIKTLRVAAA